MSQTASTLVQKVWSYAHVMRDDGLSFLDYTEQITYLLFLKIAWERASGAERKGDEPQFCWGKMISASDDAKLARTYQGVLRKLSTSTGLLGLIFTKPQSKIEDAAKLRRLVRLVDEQEWATLDVDVKGEIYEGLLARNAEDVRGGAGQYFTPRPVIRAIVDVMGPEPTMRISDPACGTGGFLLAAHEYVVKRYPAMDDKTRKFVDEEAMHGNDIVASVARLCGMNLFLHGMGGGKRLLVDISDSLAKRSSPVDMVLTNPPFGKKSSFTVIHDDGKRDTEKLYYERKDFWATTSNKQLNFVQNVYTMLVDGGRAAMVVPDNVLFEGGVGEEIRRAVLNHCDVHTLLRLPTGIWYSAGVKANVLFFDKKSGSGKPATKKLWVYDLRTNKNFTLRQNPIADEDLGPFVDLYQAEDRERKRRESERFKCFSYSEIMERDKANLDIFWLKDDSLTDIDNLAKPEALASAILRDLEDAMKAFTEVERELKR
ncbi:MAG TPA: N-6 DNA methylase [Tepidisphaeraceae bacterium]|jgi:type I restriction enzyme M protein|nr:N-6 DNA methylase [Tepidisphaeraceae bacterium]